MSCLWPQVNEVTPELFTVAPDAAAMAALDIPIVQKIIQPIGLAPTKAKNLVNMAKVRHGASTLSNWQCSLLLSVTQLF